MKRYCVNSNSSYNPGYNHEVHTQEHAEQLNIRDKLDLGFCNNEIEAVAKAKQYYSDADGCAICCPLAHKG